MILTVDIGNTTIALTGLERSGDDFDILFADKMPSDKHFLEPLERVLGGLPKIENAVLSSVVPKLTEPVCHAVEQIIGKEPKIINAASYRGILNIAIPEPEKLGLDRIADSAWAAVKYPLPAVTVDLGTAATFNVIGEGGTFLGGMIAAGLQTSLNALSERAAQLPKLTLAAPEKLIGTNTAECMLSGTVIGAAAMIDGIADRVEAELGKAVTLILTGGGARLIDPMCRRPHIYEPFMQAKGLALI